MSKVAVITGADGQDGSYLAEILLTKNYKVYGLLRPGTSPPKNLRKFTLEHVNFTAIKGDVNIYDTLIELVLGLRPDEIYHLAALSHVGDSFKHPHATYKTNFISTQRLLDLVRDRNIKFYFAGSSETLVGAEDHNSPFTARSPYAISKMAAQQLVIIYRQAYGVFAINGIAFNHESQRRGPNFVTRKLALGMHNFKRTGEFVKMGRNDVYRDWHHAYDTMMGAWLAMQYHIPQDYTFASGESRSVLEFAQAAATNIGVNLEDAVQWGESEKRPWDVDFLRGNPAFAEKELGWERSYDWPRLVEDICYDRK